MTNEKTTKINQAITGIKITENKLSITEVFCDRCGESCMHEGHNYIGISMDIQGTPPTLRDAVGFDKFNACYPCWIESMQLVRK